VREVVLSVPDLSARRVPDLDVKSGRRSTGWTTVEVFDLASWAFLLLPLGPLSSALLRSGGARGVRVELPVTRATARRRRAAEMAAGLGLAAGAFALLRGLLEGRPALVGLGAVLLVAGALVATVGLSALWVRGRLVEEDVHLRGVHRAFADGVVYVRALGRRSAA
jgi:hypothetical protein